MGITFMLTKDAPEHIKNAVPTHARFVAVAALKGITAEQYALYRSLTRAAAPAPLMENEFSGAALGLDEEYALQHFYIVAFA